MDKEIDLVLEEVKTDDDFLFTAYSITKDFVQEKDLSILAEDSVGKPLVWRHEHPVIPKFSSTHIYGKVLDSTVKDGKLISTYKVYGHTKEHEKVRDVIKSRFELGDPIKISMRFREYHLDGNPIHYDVIE
ncbi:MAG: hypothetical protein ACTSYF_08755, partial [Promethearchaeota archaeon]